MAEEIRQGSAPNFCPPVEEGLIIDLEDESGDVVALEFLGLILHEGRSYGFFLPAGEDEEDEDYCELVVLEVTELDEDGQPAAFELVLDEAIAEEVFEDFRQATEGLYEFA